MGVAADFKWKDVVIGADLNAIEFAYDNKYFLIKNRVPYHHSYEGIEDLWAEKIYHLYDLGCVPFLDKAINIRILEEEKTIKVFTGKNVFTVQYENIHIFDYENVEGTNTERELLHYRVIDWFDCRGLSSLKLNEFVSDEDFVRKIKLFKSGRVDGKQEHRDLLCESFLTEKQLKNFDYSDTMARFKVVDILKKNGANDIKLSFWKREAYPKYKTI